MPTVEREVLFVPAGYATEEAASTMAQLDDQSERLFKDLAGITAAELEWQPGRGQNTIGMLLAHNAIVEVLWSQVGIAGAPVDTQPVLDLEAWTGDGMPLPEDGAPPAHLAGKPA
jgi:hypothetical protein